jgi:truncated hemoglobin YjbI
LIGLVVLVIACTPGGSTGPSGTGTPSRASTASPDPDRFAGERLLVLTDDGNVVTVGADGSDLRSLTEHAPGGVSVEVRHPVWSPDGRSIAWAELEIRDEGASSRIVTADLDGSDRVEIPVDTGTFFLQWDPTSARIAYLGNFQGSVGMGVAGQGIVGGPVAKTIGRGRPFYLSWGPGGLELLVHVGGRTLGRLDLEGDVRPIGDVPGIFQAPVWLADGRMFYATVSGDRQALVVRDGANQRELLSFEGAIEFVVSPRGERVAYRIDDGSGPHGVDVIDVASARSQTVTDAPALAFQWSPDGSRLLVLAADDGSEQGAQHWLVWDGRSARQVGSAFVPSPTFLRDYVPFYGQFAQAMTPWSPDGGAFAFAGLIDDRAGIWVQDLAADEPTLVLEGGTVVAWAPMKACRPSVDCASVLSETTVFESAGGMPFFEQLVSRFYDGVAGDPVLRPLYPADLAPSTRHLTLFLAQYWGGPTTYDAERGHPRLRMRHAPFAIGPAERDRWLVHMRAAVSAMAPPEPIHQALIDYFEMAAEAMRNRE